MYIKFNATVIGIETWYWATVNGCWSGWGDFTLCLLSLSVTPSPFLTFFHSSCFFVSLCLYNLCPCIILSSSLSSLSMFSGANHRALEGAAGEGGEREGRRDGVQQEGAEGVEGESFPAAGWPCWPRGRAHTQIRTHTYIHICTISQKTLSSTFLSRCLGDVIDLSLQNRPSNPPAVRTLKDNNDKTVTFPWQQYAKTTTNGNGDGSSALVAVTPVIHTKQPSRRREKETGNDNTFSDDVVSLSTAERLSRKVSINHFRKAVYVFNTVSAQRFK